MSGLTRGPVSPTAAGRHARLPRSAGLHGVCLTTLIALVLQFVLGMFLNLYVTVPSSDTNAGYLQEIANGPVSLAVHVLLGLVLIGAAVLLLIRAIGEGNRVLASLAATGLAAILAAFAAGETFVRNGQASASLWMAILTGVALVSYIGVLNLVRVTARKPAPRAPQPVAPAGQCSDDFWPAPGPGSSFPAQGFPAASPRSHSRNPAAQPGLIFPGAPSRSAPRGGWGMTPPPPNRNPADDFPRVIIDDTWGKPPW